MTDLIFNDLGITLEELSTVISLSPKPIEEVFWHKIIKAYYKAGARNTAQVYCVVGVYESDMHRWNSSTRKNDELVSMDRFIHMPVLVQLYQDESKRITEEMASLIS